MTSNLGSDHIMQLLEEQPEATEGDLQELLRPILRDHFQTVIYRPLAETAMRTIVEMKLNQVSQRLHRHYGLTTHIGKSLYDALTSACQMPVLPEITFSSATEKGLVVQAQRRVSRALHPGPVLLPVTLEPGQQHQVVGRWVAGDVYDDSHSCITTTEAVIDLDGHTLSVPTSSHMCAPKGCSEFFTTGGSVH